MNWFHHEAHTALQEHGYRVKTHPTSEFSPTKYTQKGSRHSVYVQKDGKWAHRTGKQSEMLESPTQGSDIASLRTHLTKVHSSQHSEEAETKELEEVTEPTYLDYLKSGGKPRGGW